MSERIGTDFCESTRDHLNTYILAADRKAATLITGLLAFLGLFFNAVSRIEGDLSLIVVGSIGLTAISGAVAVAFAGLVIYPRTYTEGNGMIFWKDILNYSMDDYTCRVSEMGQRDALEETAESNYSLARVADRKYKHLRNGMKSGGLMLIFAGLSATCLML